jgi:hydroxypyruvate reductase 1
MAPGLSDCKNAVIVPHIASASLWTRSGMATLAAANVAGLLAGYPIWNKADILPFVDGDFDAIPLTTPSVVNAADLKLTMSK